MTKFFDLYTIGSVIFIFGSSVALCLALLFTDIDNRNMPLSPLFIIPFIISIIGITVIYIGEKYHD